MGCLFGSAKRYLIFFWFIASIGLMVSGCEETRIAWRCTANPVAVQIEQLEQGLAPGSDYISLDAHVGLIDAGVFEYWLKKGEKKTDPVTDATKINKLYYPAFSKHHPLAQGEDPAKAGWYKVLIVTDRYKTVRDVRKAQPEGSSLEMPPITGVVINTIDPLDDEERQLLREGFPLLSLDTVTILEEGRVPKSRASALSTLILGLLLLLLPPIGYVLHEARKRGAEQAPGAYTPPPSMAPAHLAQSIPAPAYGPPTAQPSVRPPPASSGWPVASGSLPPSGSPGSLAPASARFSAGARVCVTRNSQAYFGSVLKTQQGQVYVDLDDGRKVWVAQELVSFA